MLGTISFPRGKSGSTDADVGFGNDVRYDGEIPYHARQFGSVEIMQHKRAAASG